MGRKMYVTHFALAGPLSKIFWAQLLTVHCFHTLEEMTGWGLWSLPVVAAVDAFTHPHAAVPYIPESPRSSEGILQLPVPIPQEGYRSQGPAAMTLDVANASCPLSNISVT